MSSDPCSSSRRTNSHRTKQPARASVAGGTRMLFLHRSNTFWKAKRRFLQRTGTRGFSMKISRGPSGLPLGFGFSRVYSHSLFARTKDADSSTDCFRRSFLMRAATSGLAPSDSTFPSLQSTRSFLLTIPSSPIQCSLTGGARGRRTGVLRRSYRSAKFSRRPE
jgi:hypothetical protein